MDGRGKYGWTSERLSGAEEVKRRGASDDNGFIYTKGPRAFVE